jgi:hypothetical protein
MRKFPAPAPFTAEQSEFYAALGWAISKWQIVEDELGELFAELLGRGNSFAAKAAFHGTSAFRGQLDMVDWAAKAALQRHPLLATWLALYPKLRRGYGRRNDLAHHTVIETIENHQSIGDLSSPKFF